MSTVNKPLRSRYEERNVDGNIKLNIKKNVLDQIDYLHGKVGAKEWSGILVYKVLKGSIEDHKNMEIEVQEILPMDVGTSGYTEYEISPDSDDYTFDNLSRVMMDPGLKMGHIHTHHNMNCFFSGTDSQELHDNAPNHNYYLSLIVNFKDPSNWCAEVAYVGEEEQKGTIKSRFRGTIGEYIEKAFEVNKKVETLHRIKVDISVEEQDLRVEEAFADRLAELMKPKPVVRPNWGRPAMPQNGNMTKIPSWADPNHGNYIPHWDKSTTLSEAYKSHQTVIDFPGMDDWTGDTSWAGLSKEEEEKLTMLFTEEKCEKFLVKLIHGTVGQIRLEDLVMQLEAQLGSEEYDENKEAEKDVLLLNLQSNFSHVFESVFEEKPTQQKSDILMEFIDSYFGHKYAELEVFQDIIFGLQ